MVMGSACRSSSLCIPGKVSGHKTDDLTLFNCTSRDEQGKGKNEGKAKGSGTKIGKRKNCIILR